ncbi:MAG TPA: N-acetylmuramoyl-L-alanine amidase [Thermoanaerobaculia bacterium]|nr:N-acetylmuramoyl-L-alanine amidase [Thermoanaerobaculia bacterium]
MNSIRSRTLVACLAGFLVVVLAMIGSAAGQSTATLVFRGQSYPIATSGADFFSVGDVAHALGLTVSRDPRSGVLTITQEGHAVVVPPAAALIAVDQRSVEISKPTRAAGGVLYAPMDLFAKAIFPLVGASGVYDSGNRVWTLSERRERVSAPAPPVDSGEPIALDVTVVHVDPTTQVVIRESGAARFLPRLTESGMHIQWLDRPIRPPFSERRFDDPLVAAIRFDGDTATVVFRESRLTANAYPLTGPDRIVVEVGPAVETSPIEPAAPPRPSVPAITIVVDPGHGGTETGAVGPGGLQEKDVTLQIARRLAAAIPKVLSSRVVLTRDSDSAISLDDRTSVANHEKANLFLSLHANSSRATGAHGSETYYLSLESSDRISQEVARRENEVSSAPPALGAPAQNPDLDFILWDLAQSAHINESSRLAEAIQTQLNVVSKTENRGIKQAPFRVLSGAAMPAVLVEIGFISHAEEEKQLRSATFQESVAGAIARAVGEFFARRQTAAPVVGPTPAATPSPAR